MNGIFSRSFFIIKKVIMNRSIIAYSSNVDCKIAIEEILKKLKSQDIQPILIVFFSSTQDFEYYTVTLHNEFKNSTIIGSTSYKNICTDGFGHIGISALAIYSGIECSSGILFEIQNNPANYIRNINDALTNFSNYENLVCLEFCNSFICGEELVLDAFDRVLKEKNIPITGSSSGNKEEKFNELSSVSLNGNVYSNSCVFVFIKNLEGKIYFYEQNYYVPTEQILIPTDIDYKTRTVYEFNGKNAQEYLSQLLKVSKENLKEYFLENPIARNYGNNYYLTQIQNINQDGSIKFYSQVYNQTKLVLTKKKEDINLCYEETNKAITQSIVTPSFGICIDSFFNIKYLEKKELFLDYVNFLNNSINNYVSICGFGQQINNINLNQSSVFVLFE